MRKIKLHQLLLTRFIAKLQVTKKLVQLVFARLTKLNKRILYQQASLAFLLKKVNRYEYHAFTLYPDDPPPRKKKIPKKPHLSSRIRNSNPNNSQRWYRAAISALNSRRKMLAWIAQTRRIRLEDYHKYKLFYSRNRKAELSKGIKLHPNGTK